MIVTFRRNIPDAVQFFGSGNQIAAPFIFLRSFRNKPPPCINRKISEIMGYSAFIVILIKFAADIFIWRIPHIVRIASFKIPPQKRIAFACRRKPRQSFRSDRFITRRIVWMIDATHQIVRDSISLGNSRQNKRQNEKSTYFSKNVQHQISSFTYKSKRH